MQETGRGDKQVSVSQHVLETGLQRQNQMYNVISHFVLRLLFVWDIFNLRNARGTQCGEADRQRQELNIAVLIISISVRCGGGGGGGGGDSDGGIINYFIYNLAHMVDFVTWVGRLFRFGHFF